MNYKISCIIAIYNTELYLEDCLESVVKQDMFEDIEVLMIDDGSQDNSAKICEQFASKYPNMVLHSFENGGPGKARNRGLELATGQYITFLDSDDILPVGAYNKMYGNAIQYNCDIVTGNVMRLRKDGTIKQENLHRIAFKDDYYGVKYSDIENICFDTITCNKLFLRSLLNDNNIRFPENILYEDILFSAKAYLYSNRMSAMTENVYYWRITDNSITRSRNNTGNFTDRLSVIEMTLEFIKSKNSMIYYESFIKKIVTMDIFLYIKALSDGDVNSDYFDAFTAELIKFSAKYADAIEKYCSAEQKLEIYYIINNKKREFFEYMEHSKIKNSRKKSDRYSTKDGVQLLLYDKRAPESIRDNSRNVIADAIIENLKVDDSNQLVLEGYAYFETIAIKTVNDAIITAKIINIDTNTYQELSLSRFQKNELDDYYKKHGFVKKSLFKINNATFAKSVFLRKSGGAFSCVLDSNLFEENGRYKIQLRLESCGFTRETFLKKGISMPGTTPVSTVSIDDAATIIYYNTNGELVLKR